MIPHDFLGYVSLVSVVKDDPEGFARTIDSFCNASLLAKFEVIVYDGSVYDQTVEEVLHQKISNYPNLQCRYYWDTPNGIYSAMNNALAHCNSQFVQFINSGDCVDPQSWLKFIILSKSSPSNELNYGHSSWNNKSGNVGLVLPFEYHKNLVPFLGRMPNHQCMLIPTIFQKLHPYKSQKFPIAADLDFKHFANTQYLLNDTGLTIVISTPGGASQKITTFNQLLKRAREFSSIQFIYQGYLSGLITFFVFLSWHSRKVLFSYFQKLVSNN